MDTLNRLQYLPDHHTKTGDSELPWYTIHNINTIDSPALVVYKDRVAANIRLLLGMVQDTSHLRPHVKTNKIAEVCMMMMDAGISKFKCATIAEAEMLAMAGAEDVLLAYQPTGPKAHRLLQLVKAYPATHFSCLTDHPKVAKALSAAATEHDLQLAVYIDLNTGMNRTGIKLQDAMDLYALIKELPGLYLAGIHAYDGHIRDTDLAERSERCDTAFEQVLTLAESIENDTNRKLTLVVGGSPTFPVHARRSGVECSPGTFIFWDWGYKHQVPDEPFDYAALVVSRVISIVDGHTITTDLGHKSVAAENPLPRVHFLNAPDAVPTGQSEEHLVLNVPDSSIYQPGNVLYGVPVHICPTVALYDTAVVVDNNTAVDTWKVVARDRKINY